MPDTPEKSKKALERLGKQLLKACSEKKPDLEKIRSMLRDGAFVNYISDWDTWQDTTPLVRAVCRGNTEVAKLLVECGANIHIASRRCRGEIFPLLVKAIEANNPEIAAMLIDKGARFDVEYLTLALQKKNRDIVKLLLAKGVRDLEKPCPNTTKNYAVHLAEKSGDPVLLQMVRDELARRTEAKKAPPPPPASSPPVVVPPPPDPREMRIADLERQLQAVRTELTALREELHPKPVILDKPRLRPQP